MKPIILLLVLFSFGLNATPLPIVDLEPTPINIDEEIIPKVKALNNYVDFINESTHGMLIVVKLLENFNLDINKYVDLASYQINQYNNNDLPGDIFEDKDRLFYEVPPYELYQKALASGSTLSSKADLDAYANNMKSIISSINQIRFDLEDLIKGKDLTNKEDLGKVYQKLEEAVNRYEDFFIIQKKMEKVIYKEAKTINKSFGVHQDLFDKMLVVYGSSRELLLRLRDKETNQFHPILRKFNTSADEIVNFVLADDAKVKTSKFKFNWNNYTTSVKNINNAFNEFDTDGSVSEQYKIYGKYYYYYNVNCISKFNRYGTGIVIGMNNIIELLDLPTVKFTELPHYFKVIYPKKLEKVDFVESSIKQITYIPEEIKSRKVSTTNKKIRVTQDVVEFLFFDHMIADGDLVSVNFNGEWIMEKEELEIAPKKFKLKLNKEGKNYLLLHADNVGQRPPCTIGVSYMMGGSKKEIILSSDLEVSEMIELDIIE